MNVGIVGLGLIGGSIGLRLRNPWALVHRIGTDSNPEHADKALKLGIVDQILSLEDTILKSDVICIAAPADSILKMVPQILDIVDQQIVIEMGSTKKALLDRIDLHPKRDRLVAAHPMAGTEYTGPDAAFPSLFEKKCVVFVDKDKSSTGALSSAQQLFEFLGMYLTFMDKDAHDLHAAYVSHISHVSSFALAITVLEKEKDEDRIFELASGGFDSTVRLAKSSPNMWAPIFMQNRENVIDVLQVYINELNRFQSYLVNGEQDSLLSWIESANAIKRIIS